MAYSTDSDLELKRNGIVDLLPDGTSGIRAMAESDMLHDLELLWYRSAAETMGYDWRETPMNAENLVESELKRLSVLATLRAIYEHLMLESEDISAYERMRDKYDEQYQKMLQQLIDAGISYDWDEDGEIEDVEKDIPRMPVRLVRA